MLFQVGEIALLVNAPNAPEARGTEVQIVAVGPYPPGYKPWVDRTPSNEGMDYIVSVPAAGEYREWLCKETSLRKRYDGHEKSSWDVGVWKPIDLHQHYKTPAKV